MKKGLIFAVIFAIGVFATLALAQAPTYVGSAKCKICHSTEKQGQQYPIWEKSNHSKSFAALSSPDAAANATALGVKDPTTDAKCLKCHAPLAGDLKPEGVSCEVCHGPGSAYKSLNVMKVKDDAVKAGLVLYANPDAIKAKCLTCHQDAHGKTFDFAGQWAKIKHTIPAK
jgi:hypothetical protein